MRFLIDGYNVMYAGGLLGKKLGPELFRKARTRFLNTLVEALGPVDAHQTTVVFDAPDRPPPYPSEARHKGVSVIYAVNEDDADERIEKLIAKHANPRTLTVVSTDRRIRQAAERRGSTAETAEDFWVRLDTLRERKDAPGLLENEPPKEPRRDRTLSAEESQEWLEEFGDLDDLPDTREALGGANSPMLTDEEIAELEREIDREMG